MGTRAKRTEKEVMPRLGRCPAVPEGVPTKQGPMVGPGVLDAPITQLLYVH